MSTPTMTQTLTAASMLPLLLFCLSTMLTPGPNNIMLTASGANFGYRRTLPHIAGVALGMGAQVLLVGLGLGRVFIRFPVLHTGLAVAGSAYLLWLAWKISRFQGAGRAGTGAGSEEEAGRPLTLFQAAMFQWVNPKAWMMCVGAVSTFTTPGPELMRGVFVITAFFLVLIPPCISVWTLLGVRIGGWLHTDGHRRAFNTTLALLLVGSLVLMHGMAS